MKIGEATFQEPTGRETIERANAVERAVLEAETGQWVPVELDRPGQAKGLVKAMKERGYKVRRTRLIVHVKAGEMSRPHVHRYRYPSDAQDATKATGRCPCGATKPPTAESERFDDGDSDEE